MTRVTWRLGIAALALIFVWFTWRGMLYFFSGDDMMNMYLAWQVKPLRLALSQFLIWVPVYRPLGAAVYRIFYAVFGFHPLPLYIFCWLLLALNAAVSVRFFRALRLGFAGALVAAGFALIHGNFQDLYISAGTMYDRFWFLFTTVGLIVYSSAVLSRGWRLFLLCILCLLCMNSKESGVTLPVLFACYECVFVLPELVRAGGWRAHLKRIAPLYTALAALSVLFVFGRVKHTPELASNAAYHPHPDPVLWFTRLAEYWRILTYHHIDFSALVAGAVLFGMLGLALLMRNKSMVFGWLFLVITITPVALIASRPGYVLYVPDLGLGLYLGALAQVCVPRAWQVPAVAAFLLAITAFHLRNWPHPDSPHNPEYQLSTQLIDRYPKLPTGANFLFVADNFPRDAWDLTFNLRLLYHDPTITAHRLLSPPDQQPDPANPIHYDHVFALESGTYDELDNRDFRQSIRMHLLRDYAPGRELDFSRRDHVAYLVSGIDDADASAPSRWTSPHAALKFDIMPAPALFTAKFWLPDFVARGVSRSMTILVNGHKLVSYPLVHEGMNELAVRVRPEMITPNGLTIVEMDVANPYKDADGMEYGVVLLRAGFEYRPR